MIGIAAPMTGAASSGTNRASVHSTASAIDDGRQGDPGPADDAPEPQAPAMRSERGAQRIERRVELTGEVLARIRRDDGAPPIGDERAGRTDGRPEPAGHSAVLGRDLRAPAEAPATGRGDGLDGEEQEDDRQDQPGDDALRPQGVALHVERLDLGGSIAHGGHVRASTAMPPLRYGASVARRRRPRPPLDDDAAVDEPPCRRRPASASGTGSVEEDDAVVGRNEAAHDAAPAATEGRSRCRT